MERSQVEKDLSIDKNALDDEWINHPASVFHYSELAVDAEQVLERIELKKDTTVARLDELARASGEKMTEAGVKNWIIRHPDYQAVEEERISARYDCNMYKAVVKAMDHKRKGLEKLVDLYLSNYYAEPRRQVGESLVSERVAAELERVMSKPQLKKETL